MPTPVLSLEGKRVYVAGHQGMVGSAIVRRLKRETCEIIAAPRSQVDLRRQAETEAFLAEARPDVIFLAAARVGGIIANRDRPAEFLYDNLTIECNVIEAARRIGVKKLVILGSSCIYPREAPQPIRESALLTGPLEPTNEAYAVAKIAGIKLAQSYRKQYGCNFICVQPCNLYGPNDNFSPDGSHVIPALMRKAHEAKTSGSSEWTIWGSGAPLREFMYVDDLADALVFLCAFYDQEEIINVGSGEEISIAALAQLVASVVKFEGQLKFDLSKPDGTPRKLMDSSRLQSLGWRSHLSLEHGLKATYEWFLSHQETLRLERI